ncbi:MAG TPA: ABC transporter permease [Firmicutes bacterium]|nr:ABC transporter permease [Bacillota bacterium]HBT16761.1 ABC transporter permease [Bacillota bacterium]
MYFLRRCYQMDCRRTALPYFLLAPTLIFLLFFFVVPLFQVIGLAFSSEHSIFTLRHFNRMFGDIYYQDAVINTLKMAVIIIPIQLVVAFLSALIINKRFKGSTLFLYIYAIPLGISELGAGLIWLSIFTEKGYLNSILYQLGILKEAVIYLSYQSPQWIMTAIVITEVWRATPLVMIILLSGLQMIAKDYLEAADIFGANWWQKVWLIILPLLKPSIQSALIIRTLLAFQVFGPIIVLAGRLFPVMASESFFWYTLIRNEHVAATYALLLMVISMIITWSYLVFLKTKDEQVGVL